MDNEETEPLEPGVQARPAQEWVGAAEAAASDLTHLRPTTALELLDRAFGILSNRPGLYLALGVLAALPPFAAKLVYLVMLPKATSDEQFVAQFFIHQLLPLLLQQWPVAAVIAAAFQTLLFPKRALRLWTVLRGSFARVLDLVVTRTLIFLFLMILGLLLPYSLLSSQQGESVGVLISFVALWCLFFALYFYLMWQLAPIVVIVERRGFPSAVVRSLDLMRTEFRAGLLGDTALRRLLLLALFPGSVALLNMVIVHLMGLVLTGEWVSPTMPALPGAVEAGATSRVMLLVEAITSFVTAVVVIPWAYTALTLLYSECRMRREALDIQVRLLTHGDLAAQI